MNARNSTFELLRIISMFFIILYHQILYFIYPWTNDIFFKIIQIPLHIGVILFVLISGYWGIKTSLKGFTKLLLPILIYYVGFTLIYKFFINSNSKIEIHDILFISQSPYWFIRTYLYLYLLSPFINKVIFTIDYNKSIILLLILGFLSIYMGTMSTDMSLYEGKNIINFTFLYVLGYHINKNKEKIFNVNRYIWILLYILLNLFICIIYYLSDNTYFGNIIWICSFNYCSPLLIINALLFFFIISSFNIHSKTINSFASSTFAMYLIHEQPIIKDSIIRTLNILAYNNTSTPITLFFFLVIITIIIMCSIVMIDKILVPIWNLPNIIIKK